MNTAALGGAMRARRESLEYSQQALAESIGKSQKFIVEMKAVKENVSLALR